MDIRADAACYYDAGPAPFDGKDILFYESILAPSSPRVLELGCGTGRVLAPLANSCAFILGVDSSQAMLEICRRRLNAEGVPPERAVVQHGDIARLSLGQTFDLITAPFRVMQNLETDQQIDGLFDTIRDHLAPGGSAILNAFRPNSDRAALLERWAGQREESVSWEIPYQQGKLVRTEKIVRVDPQRMIVYPSLIYRYYEGDDLKDEAVLNIAMRAYYPDEFAALITRHGFKIVNRWGGYSGEPYGEGPELVIQFSA